MPGVVPEFPSKHPWQTAVVLTSKRGRAAEREFPVLLTALPKKIPNFFPRYRAKNKQTKKAQKHPKKTTKTPKNTKKTPKKKFRADARKISPNAPQKSQFPWPRRGHQTGKIPALLRSQSGVGFGL